MNNHMLFCQNSEQLKAKGAALHGAFAGGSHHDHSHNNQISISNTYGTCRLKMAYTINNRLNSPNATPQHGSQFTSYQRSCSIPMTTIFAIGLTMGVSDVIKMITFHQRDTSGCSLAGNVLEIVTKCSNGPSWLARDHSRPSQQELYPLAVIQSSSKFRCPACMFSLAS